MTRDEYLKLCNEFDPEKHELWVKYGFARWKPSDYDDPIDTPLWNANDYELRPKQRELGQWIFEGNDFDVIAMDDGGHWCGFTVREKYGEWIYDWEPLDPQPQGLDHVPWQDSKIRRES